VKFWQRWFNPSLWMRMDALDTRMDKIEADMHRISGGLR
jgi:hypothetical protein